MAVRTHDQQVAFPLAQLALQGRLNVAFQPFDGGAGASGEPGLRRRDPIVPLAISATTPGGLPFEGTVSFSVEVDSSAGLLGRFITATATRLDGEAGATSEFSACIEYLQGPEIFRDGFED